MIDYGLFYTVGVPNPHKVHNKAHYNRHFQAHHDAINRQRAGFGQQAHVDPHAHFNNIHKVHNGHQATHSSTGKCT